MIDKESAENLIGRLETCIHEFFPEGKCIIAPQGTQAIINELEKYTTSEEDFPTLEIIEKFAIWLSKLEMYFSGYYDDQIAERGLPPKAT